MRIVHFEKGGVPGIAADDGSGWHGLTECESGFPATLPELIAQGADLLRTGRDLLAMGAIDLNAVRILPPVPKPPKILCVGLNYDDHLEESGLKKPVHPEIPMATLVPCAIAGVTASAAAQAAAKKRIMLRSVPRQREAWFMPPR